MMSSTRYQRPETLEPSGEEVAVEWLKQLENRLDKLELQRFNYGVVRLSTNYKDWRRRSELESEFIRLDKEGKISETPYDNKIAFVKAKIKECVDKYPQYFI